MTGLKRCSRCKRDLPASAYQRILTATYTINGALHDRPGLQSQCRECNTQSAREHRAQRRRNRQLREPIPYGATATTNKSSPGPRPRGARSHRYWRATQQITANAKTRSDDKA
jgi:hypothetical protein